MYENKIVPITQTTKNKTFVIKLDAFNDIEHFVKVSIRFNNYYILIIIIDLKERKFEETKCIKMLLYQTNKNTAPIY